MKRLKIAGEKEEEENQTTWFFFSLPVVFIRSYVVSHEYVLSAYASGVKSHIRIAVSLRFPSYINCMYLDYDNMKV